VILAQDWRRASLVEVAVSALLPDATRPSLTIFASRHALTLYVKQLSLPLQTTFPPRGVSKNPVPVVPYRLQV